MLTRVPYILKRMVLPLIMKTETNFEKNVKGYSVL